MRLNFIVTTGFLFIVILVFYHWKWIEETHLKTSWQKYEFVKLVVIIEAHNDPSPLIRAKLWSFLEKNAKIEGVETFKIQI